MEQGNVEDDAGPYRRPGVEGHSCLVELLGGLIDERVVAESGGQTPHDAHKGLESAPAGQGGRFLLTLDLAQIPQLAGLVSVQSGDTWHYQAWYRDTNPGATSNFSDAVSVTFL